MVELGERVRALRERRGWNPRQLALAAGVDPAYVYRIEDGGRRPSHQTLTNLAGALGVAVSDLTGQTEPELLTAGEDFATAHRWAALAPALADTDVEALLRTLAGLSPAARAEAVDYIAWRATREPAVRTYTDSSPAENPPRILGDTAPAHPRQRRQGPPRRSI